MSTNTPTTIIKMNGQTHQWHTLFDLQFHPFPDIPLLEKQLGNSFDKELDAGYITQVVGLIKERATFIEDLWDLGSFFFKAAICFL